MAIRLATQNDVEARTDSSAKRHRSPSITPEFHRQTNDTCYIDDRAGSHADPVKAKVPITSITPITHLGKQK